jgi:non-heme chloroperoxidase
MSEMVRTGELAQWEMDEVRRANESGLTPVVFVHGLWLLASAWRGFRDTFEAAGYTTVAPGWPDDPNTVEEAFAHPEVFARKMVQQVTDHYLVAISQLEKKPAVVGHSFGGLIAQKIADNGAAAATVAIDNAPFKGVLPLPAESLKSAAPVIGHLGNRNKAVALTFEQFKFGWANNLDDEEARDLYDRFHVPASGAPLFQAATANLNPFGGETALDVHNADRGPLLIIAGTKDNTAPLAFTFGSFKLQRKNESVTEFLKIEDRGHSLVIDHGWPDVAAAALAFVQRFT